MMDYVVPLLLPCHQQSRYQMNISYILLQTSPSSSSTHSRLSAPRGCQELGLLLTTPCLHLLEPVPNAVEKTFQVCRLLVRCCTASHNQGRQSNGIMVTVLAPV